MGLWDTDNTELQTNAPMPEPVNDRFYSGNVVLDTVINAIPAYQEQYYVNSTYSTEAEVQNRWTDSLNRYAERTGQQPNLPMDFQSIASYVKEASGEAPHWFTERDIFGNVPDDVKQKRAQFKKVNDEIKALGDPNIRPLEDVLQEVYELQRGVSEGAADFYAGNGVGGAIDWFLGSIAGSFTPREPLLLFGSAAGGFGKHIATRLATEFGVGMALSVPGAFAVEESRKRAGLPEGNPLLEVVLGGFIPAGLRGVLEGGARALAREGVQIGPLDAEDRILEQMFTNARQTPAARAGVSAIYDQRIFNTHNPYGESETGTLKFTGDINEITRMMYGRTDTAIARFLPQEDFNPADLELNALILRDENPSLHNALREMEERLTEVDAQIAAVVRAENEQPTLSQVIRPYDELTADLIDDLERTIADAAVAPAAKEAARKQLQQVVESLGDEATVQVPREGAPPVEMRIKDLMEQRAQAERIGRKETLRGLRASRKAIKKRYDAVRKAYDGELNRIDVERKIKDKAFGKPVPARGGPSETPVFNPEKLRPDVVTQHHENVTAAAKEQPATVEALVEQAFPARTTGLEALGSGMAQAISAGFVDALHLAARAGRIVDATGAKNATLQVLKRLKENGVILTRDLTEKVAREMDTIKVKGEAYQAAVRDVLNRNMTTVSLEPIEPATPFAPKAEPEPVPPELADIPPDFVFKTVDEAGNEVEVSAAEVARDFTPEEVREFASFVKTVELEGAATPDPVKPNPTEEVILAGGTPEPPKKAEAAPAPEPEAVAAKVTPEDEKVIAAAYGQPAYNDVARRRFINDVATAAVHGLEAVAAAVRNIIKRILYETTALAMVLNPSALTHAPARVFTPSKIEATVVREVPAEAADMSEAGKLAYSRVGGLAQGRGLMIVDKNEGRIHLFGKEGQFIASAPVLTGASKGDMLPANVTSGKTFSVKQIKAIPVEERVTPAGMFVTAKSKSGDFLWVNNAEGKNFQIAIHNTEIKGRIPQLGSKTHLVSFGCVNLHPKMYAELIKPNIDQFDNNVVFIVPHDLTLAEGMLPEPETVKIDQPGVQRPTQQELQPELAREEDTIDIGLEARVAGDFLFTLDGKEVKAFQAMKDLQEDLQMERAMGSCAV